MKTTDTAKSNCNTITAQGVHLFKGFKTEVQMCAKSTLENDYQSVNHYACSNTRISPLELLLQKMQLMDTMTPMLVPGLLGSMQINSTESEDTTEIATK